MTMHSGAGGRPDGHRSLGHKRRLLIVPGVAALLVALVGPVLGVITPSSTALTIAQAIASSSANVTGASFVAVPGSGTPNGTSTTALTGFPINGASYGILTSGDVNSVDDPGGFADTDDGGNAVRGNTDFDVTILKIDLSVPQGANCLTFDFRFLSEEFPRYVNTEFNDAFIAELDTSNWTTSGSTITAPNNFAFDSSNEVVSINSTGLGGMTPAAGAGTAYDGTAGPGPNTDGAATARLGAASPVTAGAHSLYLSLFDQGDNALDSAVFLDNLRVITVANPATDCKTGAVQTATLTLTKNVVNTGGGTQPASAWTLSATGPVTISGATGSAAVTGASVPAGTYALAETGPTGYTAGSWSCTGGTLAGASLTLAAGATASCSITNTFVPGPLPSEQPSEQPSSQPSSQPSEQPSAAPSEHPSVAPSEQPSSAPSEQPSVAPSKQPSAQPSGGVEAATATPRVTPPSTDAVPSAGSTGGGDGARLALVALMILAVAAIVLTPRRRHRPAGRR